MHFQKYHDTFIIHVQKHGNTVVLCPTTLNNVLSHALSHLRIQMHFMNAMVLSYYFEKYSKCVWILCLSAQTHTLFSRFSFCKHEFITHTTTDQTVTQIKPNRSITTLINKNTNITFVAVRYDYYSAQNTRGALAELTADMTKSSSVSISIRTDLLV